MQGGEKCGFPTAGGKKKGKSISALSRKPHYVEIFSGYKECMGDFTGRVEKPSRSRARLTKNKGTDRPKRQK